MPRAFTLDGRTILRDGVPVVYVDRVGDTAPVDADGYAHMFCRMLNNRGPELVDACLAKYRTS